MVIFWVYKQRDQRQGWVEERRVWKNIFFSAKGINNTQGEELANQDKGMVKKVER